jgi:Lrp/AsnC family leucine-responsive transcriptional regulator
MSATQTDTALDAIDAQLLRLLQADGRISLTKLAESVGLAPATVHERVARLKREGVILGYEAVLSPALERGLLVFAEVKIDPNTVSVQRALKAALQEHDEVLECHEVRGAFDLLIKARVPDMQGLREFVTHIVWRLPGVQAVRSYAVIEEVKNTARIPL